MNPVQTPPATTPHLNLRDRMGTRLRIHRYVGVILAVTLLGSAVTPVCHPAVQRRRASAGLA
jgi:hypothetical protein